ncbi:MAG TPA: hypothetical protein VK851_01100 [Anaerolineales bacterium]|nr:hypothetical protein [Anaerolineales bacterium]
MEYTLPLALVDFLPVIFTAIGLVYIARMVAHISKQHGQAAYVGAALTVAGGFFRALWKTFMAVSEGATDIHWMNEGLFIWMAPGYTLLLWSVWQAVRSVNDKQTHNAWTAPLVFIGLMLAASYSLYASNPASPAWERVLLTVMVLATVITGVLLIVFAFRQKLSIAGWLFIVNLIGIFLLNGLARIDEQTITLQWIEEGINTISWLCFLIASLEVFEHTRINFGVK